MISSSDLESLVNDLGSARREGKGWRCLCPAHNDQTPSLSVAIGDSGKLLVKCWNGCHGTDVLRHIDSRKLSAVAAAKKDFVMHSHAKSKRWVENLWENAMQISPGDLAHRYLQSRGITLATPVSASLRFAIECPVSGDEEYSARPALIARFDDENGNFSTVHRVYLEEPARKAAIDRPKRIASSPAKGGAIRLFPPTNQLGIAEGIETALACYLDTGVPTWAAYSSSIMPLIKIPNSVEQVIIFGDNDRSGTGQKAAAALHNRLLNEGLRVKTLIPPVVGRDWLDIYNDDQL